MIRLARHGAKKKPFYHIVAIDKRRARNAICKEKLGFYNPMEKYAAISLERIKCLLSKGAKCSETVDKLVSKYQQGQLQKPQSAKKAKTITQKAKTESAKAKEENTKEATQKNKTKKEQTSKVKAKSDTKQEKATDEKIVMKETPKKDENKD